MRPTVTPKRTPCLVEFAQMVALTVPMRTSWAGFFFSFVSIFFSSIVEDSFPRWRRDPEGSPMRGQGGVTACGGETLRPRWGVGHVRASGEMNPCALKCKQIRETKGTGNPRLGQRGAIKATI